MASYSSDRRSLLKIFGSIGATCAYPFASDELHGQTAQHQHHTAAPKSEPQPRFFNKADFAMISRIADLIIPETDSPGAIAADVPAYIDLVVARNTDQQLVVADGLRWLDTEANRIAGRKFLELSEDQQLSILEPLCEAADSSSGLARGRNVQFFSLIKNLTADGYYTSRVGLMEELEYKGNAALPSFPDCMHEH
ncbi:MAG: gluconate 2-dehydrogenase subunit 3 family protein [Bryobacteraceae bacterium]